MAQGKHGEPEEDSGGDRVEPVEDDSGQRARARSKTGAEPPTKRERVKHFYRLMRDQQYVRHITIGELAEQWGLAEDTLERDAAEASRKFEDSDEEKANGKALWLEQLRSSTENARRLDRCEAEARFLELQAKAQGYLEPQKVELSGSLGDLLALATGAGGEDPDKPVEG